MFDDCENILNMMIIFTTKLINFREFEHALYSLNMVRGHRSYACLFRVSFVKNNNKGYTQKFGIYINIATFFGYLKLFCQDVMFSKLFPKTNK